MAEEGYRVVITDQGHAGTVEYVEGDLRLPLWWEFTTGGAWVWAPSPVQWDAYWASSGAPQAAGRRDEILQRVARECVRQRATSVSFEVDEDGVSLRF